LISHRQDLQLLPQLGSNVQPVPLSASSWVFSELYRPLPREQCDIDLIMVANFGKFKRHHVLFRALRQMPRDLRLHLIGQEQDGRTAETLHQLARVYGVEGRFTLQVDARSPDVVKALCRSRASVILSRNEGSCVVVAESLFANTPVALLQGAVIGSGAFINPQTGRFLREKNLARELTRFVRESASFSPRQWAEENIDCFRSRSVLNDQLKQSALQSGQPWTQDIEAVCWRPFPRVMDEQARLQLQPAREAFQAEFGLRLP
jgi:glycosyltransferase involved in cell wall biosynthesis